MVFTLPSFQETINNQDDRKKKIFTNNISYEPIYGTLYNTDPKIVDVSGEKKREENVSIFDLPLSVIFKNIANTLLLIIMDLTNFENYSNIQNFLKIFMVENRLMYFGIFVILIAIYVMLFFG
jgi:hypothetical protein